jgi:hypothetical protein
VGAGTEYELEYINARKTADVTSEPSQKGFENMANQLFTLVTGDINTQCVMPYL